VIAPSDGIPARRFPFVNVALIAANYVVFIFFSARANGGGMAFYAHVGGFVFGLVVAKWLASLGAAPGRAGEGELAGAGVTA
jgi:membrane associated rhomboid family serine protease